MLPSGTTLNSPPSSCSVSFDSSLRGLGDSVANSEVMNSDRCQYSSMNACILRRATRATTWLGTFSVMSNNSAQRCALMVHGIPTWTHLKSSAHSTSRDSTWIRIYRLLLSTPEMEIDFPISSSGRILLTTILLEVGTTLSSTLLIDDFLLSSWEHQGATVSNLERPSQNLLFQRFYLKPSCGFV